MDSRMLCVSGLAVVLAAAVMADVTVGPDDGFAAVKTMGDTTYFRPKFYVLCTDGDIVEFTMTKDLSSAVWTNTLVAEGLAREFVSHVQSMRKEADFEVTQRIALTVEADEETRAALEAHLDYVKNETLTTEFAFAAIDAEAVVLNGHSTKIAVVRV